jgi:hypothetical protein
MALRTSRGCCAALLAGCAIALTFPVAAIGDSSLAAIQLGAAPAANEAPSYDSDYAAGARIRGAAADTPEADARPGEYYFAQGAQAFRKKEYTFAIQMYEVAASWAFKPAEYNLGVMYARGQGVPVDMPRAMAWMALAAERNEPHYIDAREAVYAELTKEQFEQANAIWRELKQTYGDDVALKRAKARWAEVRSQMTGSRVGSVGNLSVGMPEANSGDPSNQKKQKTGANVHTTAGTAAEITGGTGIDGSLAYSQLLRSDNPYDPKFASPALGTAIVGPPTTLKGNAPDQSAMDPVQRPEPDKHDD